MARGGVAKEEIIAKIMSAFDGAFMNGKELRIPWTENGERVEIKVALTCAKENVGGEAPAGSYTPKPSEPLPWDDQIPEATPAGPSEEEKARLQKLVQELF